MASLDLSEIDSSSSSSSSSCELEDGGESNRSEETLSRSRPTPAAAAAADGVGSESCPDEGTTQPPKEGPPDAIPTNPMDVELDGTPLSVLFGQAAKLKSAQSAPDRSRFDSNPSFLQNTVFPRQEVLEARGEGEGGQEEGKGQGGQGHGEEKGKKSFEERMDAAVKFKGMGNELFKGGNYGGAVGKYEMAAGVFRYLENTNPNWKTEGIKDEYITEHFYRGSTPSQRHSVATFLASCYTNIALASLRSRSHRLAVHACDEALWALHLDELDLPEEDESSVRRSGGKAIAKAKALYLRARARLEPKSSGAAEQEMALRDLERANEFDPNNGTVSKELKSLRCSIKSQRRKDRATFGGLFGRGEIYDENGSGANASPDRTGEGRGYTIGETLALADLCGKRGMKEEERALRDLVEKNRKEASRLAEMDFRNPTEKMKEEAKAMGVNLTDPDVVDVLEGLQRKKRSGKGAEAVAVDGTTMKMNEPGSDCGYKTDDMGAGGARGMTAGLSLVKRQAIRLLRTAFVGWKRIFVFVGGTDDDKVVASRHYLVALVLVLAIRFGAVCLFR